MKPLDQFNEELQTAYSTPAYGGDWRPCIKMMRRRGFQDEKIELIIRSKVTRWAGDCSRNKYGRYNSADLARFLDSSPGSVRAVLGMI